MTCSSSFWYNSDMFDAILKRSQQFTFSVLASKGGGYRWYLLNHKGEIRLISDKSYKTRQDAEAACDVFKTAVAKAEVKKAQ